ncbi:MAG TPA: universal stress protein [Alphaproteobacteria bacterium]|jgi:nucleotide-binding universal stress UspA family protein
MERILIPVDGSKNAERAVAYVIDMIRKGRAVEVHLATVRPPLRENVARFIARSEIESYHQEEGEKALASAKRLLDEAGIPYTTHIGVGVVPETIVAFADDIGADEIVMGTRGLGGLAGLLLGSVATEVIRQAKVPVTLVK